MRLEADQARERNRRQMNLWRQVNYNTWCFLSLSDVLLSGFSDGMADPASCYIHHERDIDQVCFLLSYYPQNITTILEIFSAIRNKNKRTTSLFNEILCSMKTLSQFGQMMFSSFGICLFSCICDKSYICWFLIPHMKYEMEYAIFLFWLIHHTL